MNTPIVDFVKSYADSGTARLHMPGHKGNAFLGFEKFDITEIKGADALYEADGIIAESEKNASRLFKSGMTLYSAEGSSQCIKAMLALLRMSTPPGEKCTVLAARNVHKAFVHAAALCRIDVEWLFPEDISSLCRCPVTPTSLRKAIEALPSAPSAVYITSPDYLGGMADIAALSEVCRAFKTLLIVDNAHGAYLHFLERPLHPLDLGADMCCDSAHKTLPVLTGGAYLHISKNAPAGLLENAKNAMALFGSTSPSYLILSSLDAANAYIENGFCERLRKTVGKIECAKEKLISHGWAVEESDPLRITVRMPQNVNGICFSDLLRERGVECEYADRDYIVFMLTPENNDSDIEKLISALGTVSGNYEKAPAFPALRPNRILSLTDAMLSPQERVPISLALGRICGAPTVSCPPAVPIVISGEEISREALLLAEYFGITEMSVLK